MTRQKTIKALQDKSNRSLSAAKLLIERGDYDFAVSRIYYAMFYMAEALLFVRNKSYSSHSAVISGIYQEYVKQDTMPRKMHELLHRAFGIRQHGDYISDMIITKDMAQALIKDAREFVDFANDHLKALQYD